MAKDNNLKDLLTDVADAIREKKGTTELINPQDFGEEIRGIESGGGNSWNADVVWNDDSVFGFDSMQEISIHEGVTTIGVRAFRYNTSLTKVVLPSTVTTIDSYSFAGMTKLDNLLLPEGLINIQSYVFNGTPFVEMIIPKGVIRLNYGAFVNCTKLTKVIWKVETANIISIGGSCFSGCTSLIYVSFPNIQKIPTLDNIQVFNNTTCKIVVPDSLYDAWIAATNWATYADRIVKASDFVEPTNE